MSSCFRRSQRNWRRAVALRRRAWIERGPLSNRVFVGICPQFSAFAVIGNAPDLERRLEAEAQSRRDRSGRYAATAKNRVSTWDRSASRRSRNSSPGSRNVGGSPWLGAGDVRRSPGTLMVTGGVKRSPAARSVWRSKSAGGRYGPNSGSRATRVFSCFVESSEQEQLARRESAKRYENLKSF